MIRPTVSNLWKGAMALCLSLGILSFPSCSDETEGKAVVDYSAPEQVTDITSEAGPGEVYLSWKIPASKSFMYSKVVYTNAKGEEVYKLYSKEQADDNGVVNATIGGFATTEPVDFQIYACAVKGACAAPMTVTAAPGSPAFEALAESVEAVADWAGVRLKYKNIASSKIAVNVKYSLESDPSVAGEVSFSALPNSESSYFFSVNKTEAEFVNGESLKLSWTASDESDNTSKEYTATVGTKKVRPLDRCGWTFPGYNESSNDATIGYSSQEAQGEGASPKGRVIAMIDGDNGTFWHTSWKTSSSYPHFFIVDMGEEVLVSNVSIRRRSGNNGTNIGQSFFTCNADNASGASPDNWNWTSQGWAPFNRNSNNTQVFGMNQPEKARYIKVYFSEADKGGDFVMVSEFNAYTPDE